VKPRAPKHQPKAATVAAADELYRYLDARASRRRLLLLNQREVAAETGIEISRLHRLLPLLFADGRLKQIGTHAHCTKLIKIAAVTPTGPDVLVGRER
jgi:hypothetical protein